MTSAHLRQRVQRAAFLRSTFTIASMAVISGLAMQSASYAQVLPQRLNVTPATQQRVNLAFGLTESTVQSVPLQPNGKDRHLLAQVTLDDQPVTLDLKPHSLRSEFYRVMIQVENGTYLEVDTGPDRTIRGTVLEIPGSVVSGTVLDDGLHAVVSLPDGEKFWIEPVLFKAPDLANVVDATGHVVYRNSALIPSGGTCGNENLPRLHNDVEPGQQNPSGGTDGSLPACDAVIAVDVDREYYEAWFSVTNVINRVHTVISTMNTQYETQVGLTHTISTIIVRTAEPDPYTTTVGDALLCEFITQWTNNHAAVPRDVAVLFTGRDIDGTLIGRAANFAEICDNAGFCGPNLGDLDDGAYCFAQVDCCGGLGCSTDLVAHELGHLWDATHCDPCLDTTMQSSLECANTFATVSMNEIEAFAATAACVNCGPPPNDNCANATVIGVGTTAFNTFGATTDGLDEPNLCSSSGYSNVGNDVWFRFTAPCGGPIKVDLCSSHFDTKVAIYLGVCPIGTNNAIACNDDACGTQSQVIFSAISGAQYLIRIGGFFGERGSGTLNLSCYVPPPTNDECANATVIGNGVHAFSNVQATSSAGFVPFPCSMSMFNDVWFRYTTTCDGLLRVRTCGSNLPTRLALYPVNCPSPGAETIYCNSDGCAPGAFVNLSVSPGTEYLIRVGADADGLTGNGSLEITCQPGNDDCHIEAYEIGNGSYPFTTIGATTDGPNEPALCNFFQYSQIGSDVWYRYVATCTAPVTVSVCSSTFDTKIAAYQVNACPLSSSAIACNDDACGSSGTRSRLTFNAVAGLPYKIRLGGFGGATGTGTLIVTCCPTDLNGDQQTSTPDLLILINAWGPCSPAPDACEADLNGNLGVSTSDLLMLINGWGPCP